MSFVPFGEWTPDLPDIATPGLTEARNVIPSDASYRPMKSLLPSGDALTGNPKGAFAASAPDSSVAIYAGDATRLYRRSGTAWVDESRVAPYATAEFGYWRFSQYAGYVIATNFSDAPQIAVIGGDFADMAGAPQAKAVGTIRNFVFLGNLDDALFGQVPFAVQWNAIDDPTDWPIPFTDDAASKQASRQDLNAAYGPVQFIADGESFGLVFQERAITRFTYVGGSVVFQVQTFERTRGAYAPQGCVQVGNVTYFLALDGFYATDGFQVTPIGERKVNTWFLRDADFSFVERITAAADMEKGIIVWSYCGSGGPSGVPNKVIIYNFRENRWTYGEESMELIFGGRSPGYTLEELDAIAPSLDELSVSMDSAIWTGGYSVLQAFSTDRRLGEFVGAAKTGVLESAEVPLNSPGRAYVSRVKPEIDAPSTVTIALGTRNYGGNDTVWTAPASLHPRTREANFRSDAFYHRARVTMAGGFESATGIHYFFEKSGSV